MRPKPKVQIVRCVREGEKVALIHFKFKDEARVKLMLIKAGFIVEEGEIDI